MVSQMAPAMSRPSGSSMRSGTAGGISIGGEVSRCPVATVVAELEAAQDAAEAAAREARRTVREQRKAELHADLEERVGKLKEKLHVS